MVTFFEKKSLRRRSKLGPNSIGPPGVHNRQEIRLKGRRRVDPYAEVQAA